MSSRDIIEAAAILRAGGLVAFPTETVYGFGADARNSVAVQQIYSAKGRPSSNPLIVHVADESVAKKYAAEWPANASRLAERFWPGPLTLIVKKASEIVSLATAGLDSVGLRSPSHPVALDLLREFAGPIAAPSANRSTRISPTTAAHVHDELGSAVDLILDGGPCAIGIESTVLDLTAETPVILRPGKITSAEIESAIGIRPSIRTASSDQLKNMPAKSPGMQPIHYAPQNEAFHFWRHDLVQILPKIQAKTNAPAFILVGQTPTLLRGETCRALVELPREPDGYARRFYATLREIDSSVGPIFIEMPPDEPQWDAIRDRINRATKTF